ncbi:MAG: hypothetical protein M0021_10985 [Clostridia bacterium]|nr:hypothetical protein [Clostridia bacterium]
MRIEDWSLQQINITVVFENIDKDLIRRDHIRRTFDGEEVIITDFPDLLAVILPKKEAVVDAI